MQESADTHNWRDLYESALLEHDPTRLKPLIVEAHRAIQKEIRRLWYAGLTDTEERRLLDTASHYLEVLYPFIDREERYRTHG
jgi:hypothetical protein